MRKHMLKGFLCMIGILFCTLAVSAGGDIIENYSEGRYGIYYIRNLTGDINNATTQIGNEMAEKTEYLGPVSGQTGYRIRTMILIDNSNSIKEGGREQKIRDLLTQIINGHTDGEMFAISTFSQSVTLVTDFSDDYNMLLNSVQSIKYADQYAYLVNSVYETVSSLISDGTNDYKRLIVISDGIDDNKKDYNRYTSLELIDLLKNSSCPVYTIGCKWAKDDSGLTDLFSYARQSGGASFELDTISDLNEIISVIQQDYSTQLFRVKIPASALNSGEKTVAMTISTSEGDQIIKKTVQMPVISQQEINEILAEEVQTSSEIEPSTETITISTTEMVQEADNKAAALVQRIKNHLFILIAALVGLLVLMIIAVLLASRKKKEKKKAKLQYGSYDKNSFNIDDRSLYGIEDDDEEILTTKFQNNEDDLPTMFMNSEINGTVLCLSEKNTNTEFKAELLTSVIVGKKGDVCGLCIPGDKAISRRHCRFVYDNGDVYIEDLQSTNGTFLNGQRVHARTRVSSGDTLTIGDTKLIISF